MTVRTILFGGRRATWVALLLAASLERCDEQALPSVYAFVAHSFASSPSRMGLLVACRSLAQSIAAPLAGILGTMMHRGHVVASGCILWSMCAILFAMTSSVAAALPIWGLGGVSLALIVPNTQSLVADLTTPKDRGTAFGWLFLSASVGGMLGALVATNIAAIHFGMHLQGWRVAFFIIALLSAAVGGVNLVFTCEPRLIREEERSDPSREGEDEHGSLLHKRRWTAGATVAANASFFASIAAALPKMRRDFLAVLRIPTFVLIVAQGIFGSIPWIALVYLTLYLQLIGIRASTASGLVALFLLGVALGGLLGGQLGDWAEVRWPSHGRIVVAQCSVITGIPFSLLLIKGLPHEGGALSAALYATTLLIFSLLKAWPAPACINPLFAEIVPENKRTLTYALDRCLETAVAACMAPVVGLLAERGFGFSGDASPSGSRDTDLKNANALGNAILTFCVVPWGICFFLFSFLHQTVDQDRQAAAAEAAVGLDTALEPAVEAESPSTSLYLRPLSREHM